MGLTRVLPWLEWAAAADRSGLASAYDVGAALAAVRRAARRAHTVVVAVHWGDELAPCPDDVQLDLAERLVRAGADVVAGHTRTSCRGSTGSAVRWSPTAWAPSSGTPTAGRRPQAPS